jgi:hypothetical protein
MYVRSHYPLLLRWAMTAVLVGIGPATLGGCRDENSVSGIGDGSDTKPSLAQTGNLDFDASYYEADVRIAYSGGFRPGAAREYSYHLVRTLQDGAWSIELSNLPRQSSPGGSGNDVARITLTGAGDLTLTTRSGQVITAPDPATVRDGMRQAHPTNWKPSKSWLGVGTTPAPSGGQTSPLAALTGPLTHDLVGRAGRARLLSRFTAASYTEQRGPQGRRRFEGARGARRTVVELDAVTGAAVHEEVSQAGHLVAVTNREYRQAGPLALLESEVITQYDAAGVSRGRIERRLTNIRTERSR